MDTDINSLASKFENKVVVSLDSINWEEAGKNVEWAVLLKFASGRAIPQKPIDDILNNVWKLPSNGDFYKVDWNLLLVNFKSEDDQLKVLNGGPWSFNGNAIVLQKWEKGMMEEDFENTKINIWVQVRRLPFEFRNYTYGSMLAAKAGDLVEMKAENFARRNALTGQFVRVRIQLDTTKPVCPGVFLKRDGRKPVWISFKYEKLPSICFNCGLLNHDSRGCPNVKTSINSFYGNWLRAETMVENIPIWKDNQVDNGDVSFVSLPEVVGGSRKEVNSDEVRIEEAQFKISPTVTLATVGSKDITANFVNYPFDITAPSSIIHMDATNYVDTGQTSVGEHDLDFEMTVPEVVNIGKPKNQNSAQGNNIISTKMKGIVKNDISTSTNLGKFMRQKKAHT